jgi:hypothetical protein
VSGLHDDRTDDGEHGRVSYSVGVVDRPPSVPSGQGVGMLDQLGVPATERPLGSFRILLRRGGVKSDNERGRMLRGDWLSALEAFDFARLDK